MTLQEILVNKGYLVHTITPDASMADVVDMLTNYNVGSLVVVEDGQMVGIITERDVLRCLAAREASLEETRVGDRMTEGPICGELQHGVEETMGLLTQYRIRHLPVIDEGRLVGLISIGDLVKCQFDAICLENHFLKSYIQS